MRKLFLRSRFKEIDSRFLCLSLIFQFSYCSHLRLRLCSLVLDASGLIKDMSAAAAKDLRIAQGAVVCLESKLRGTITIGTKTVVHPKATILAESGPIIIGDNNIFEEQSLIRHRIENNLDQTKALMIGSNNIFEVGCTVMAKVIGDNNVFEAKCYVGPEIEVGNGCIIGSGVKMAIKDKLPDNVIITGSRCNRTVAADRPPPQTLQLDFLTKVLPNYHHLRKAK